MYFSFLVHSRYSTSTKHTGHIRRIYSEDLFCFFADYLLSFGLRFLETGGDETFKMGFF